MDIAILILHQIDLKQLQHLHDKYTIFTGDLQESLSNWLHLTWRVQMELLIVFFNHHLICLNFKIKYLMKYLTDFDYEKNLKSTFSVEYLNNITTLQCLARSLFFAKKHNLLCCNKVWRHGQVNYPVNYLYKKGTEKTHK